jgi:DNA-binding HxlR family transcriptional regulator
VLPSDYSDINCSVARTLEAVGERWSALLLRETFLGTRRFDDFQRNLGISRNVLSTRLARFVELGILKRVQYQERPARFEYRLDQAGKDLFPMLMAMTAWGDKYAPTADGPPRSFSHRDCGGSIDAVHLRCEKCGQDVGLRDVWGEAGPGAQSAPGTFAHAA